MPAALRGGWLLPQLLSLRSEEKKTGTGVGTGSRPRRWGLLPFALGLSHISARLAARACHGQGSRGGINGEFACVDRRSLAHPAQRNRVSGRAAPFGEQRTVSIRLVFGAHRLVHPLCGWGRLLVTAKVALYEEPEQCAVQRIGVGMAEALPSRTRAPTLRPRVSVNSRKAKDHALFHGACDARVSPARPATACHRGSSA